MLGSVVLKQVRQGRGGRHDKAVLYEAVHYYTAPALL